MDVTPQYLLSFSFALLCWMCGWLALGGIRFLASPGRRRTASPRAAPTPVPSPPLPFRRLSVIIPARNEAGSIGNLLDSLADSAPEDTAVEVIVVDDGSSDRTAEIAATRGVRTIPAGSLPAGWTGKNHALWVGVQESHGDQMLFLDADCTVEPGFFRHLAQVADGRSRLITVQPYHRTEGTVENLSAIFNLVVLAAFGSFRLPRQRRTPTGGYGPCMLVDRATYLDVGGHEAIRDEVLDDVALATRFARRGYGVENFAGRGSISYRMYPGGFLDLIEGWSKHLATGIAVPTPSILVMLVLWISGMVAAAAQLTGAVPLGTEMVVWATAVYIAYAAQLHYLLTRIGSFGLVPAVLFPASVGFFFLVLAYSAVKIWLVGSVQWKGRTISRKKDSS